SAEDPARRLAERALRRDPEMMREEGAPRPREAAAPRAAERAPALDRRDPEVEQRRWVDAPREESLAGKARARPRGERPLENAPSAAAIAEQPILLGDVLDREGLVRALHVGDAIPDAGPDAAQRG